MSKLTAERLIALGLKSELPEEQLPKLEEALAKMKAATPELWEKGQDIGEENTYQIIALILFTVDAQEVLEG